MDNISKERRSYVMSRIKGKNTGPERRLSMLLVRSRIKFRRCSDLPGRPDFVLFDRIAVFVDGCYWHCCPQHGSMPKSNRPFWADKFKKNVARDRRADGVLRELGYAVWRFWEHEVAKKGFAERVLRYVKWVSPVSGPFDRFSLEFERPERLNDPF